MSEKGLCRTRDETISRAALDTMMGSRFVTPVGADPPCARRKGHINKQDCKIFYSKVSSSKHTQISVLPWTALAFAVLPLHWRTGEEQTQECSKISGPSLLRESPIPWMHLETTTWTPKIQNYKMQTTWGSRGRALTGSAQH